MTHTSKLKLTVTAASLLAMSTEPISAATFVWSGIDSANLNVNNNWVGGTAPPVGSADQPATATSSDIIVFDSTTWTRAPRTLYTRTSNRWGSIRVDNGTVTWKDDGNNQGNYSWGGTNTLVVGDADTTVLAIANFNVTNWNSGDGGETGPKTYVINADGTLVSTRGGTHNWSTSSTLDTVMRLLGGTVNITGQLQESQITADAGDYVSFEAIGSTFTFAKGLSAGNFQTATSVTDAFGDSFRLAGAAASNGQLELTDGGTTWTISVLEIPEPSSLMLLGLGLVGFSLRRRRSSDVP